MLARIYQNQIIDILKPVEGFSLEECFHSDLLDSAVTVPDHLDVGWILVGEEWQAPPEPEVEPDAEIP